MATTRCVAVDVGTTTTRVATGTAATDISVSAVPSVVAVGPSGVRTGSAALQESAPSDEVLTGFVPLLAVPAADLGPAGWTSRRPPDEAARYLFERLALPASADTLAVALPDTWWTGVDGARARETARRLLDGVIRPGRREFVPRSVAAAAFWSTAEPSGRDGLTVVVCDIGARTVTATLCRCEGPTVTPVHSVSGGPPAGAAFEREALGGAAACGSSSAGLLWAAVARQRRRAEVVLARAAAVPRYRETPVYEEPDLGLVLTAGDLDRCYQPSGRVVESTLDRLVEADPGLLDGLDAVVVTGGFGRFPLALASVRGWVDASPAGGRCPVRLLDGDAVARGLLLTALGKRNVGICGVGVAVAAHRVRAGRLETGLLTVARGGRAVDPEEPVDVPATGASLEIEVDEGGRRQRLRWPAGRLAAGRHRLGWWPGRTDQGVLVLRPADGPAVLVPIADFDTTDAEASGTGVDGGQVRADE